METNEQANNNQNNQRQDYAAQEQHDAGEVQADDDSSVVYTYT